MRKILKAALEAAYKDGEQLGMGACLPPYSAYAEAAVGRLVAALATPLGGKLVELADQEWAAGNGGSPGVRHHEKNAAAIRHLAERWLKE